MGSSKIRAGRLVGLRTHETAEVAHGAPRSAGREGCVGLERLGDLALALRGLPSCGSAGFHRLAALRQFIVADRQPDHSLRDIDLECRLGWTSTRTGCWRICGTPSFGFLPLAEALSRVVPDAHRRMIMNSPLTGRVWRAQPCRIVEFIAATKHRTDNVRITYLAVTSSAVPRPLESTIRESRCPWTT